MTPSPVYHNAQPHFDYYTIPPRRLSPSQQATAPSLTSAITTVNQNADCIALAVYNTSSGPNSLPVVNSHITIYGNCAPLTRSGSTNCAV